MKPHKQSQEKETLLLLWGGISGCASVRCLCCFRFSSLSVLNVFIFPHFGNSSPVTHINYISQTGFVSTETLPLLSFFFFSRYLTILFDAKWKKIIINGWFIRMGKMIWSGFQPLTGWSEWNCVPLINCDEMLFAGWIKSEGKRNHCGSQGVSAAVSHSLAFDHIILSVLTTLVFVVCY